MPQSVPRFVYFTITFACFVTIMGSILAHTIKCDSLLFTDHDCYMKIFVVLVVLSVNIVCAAYLGCMCCTQDINESDVLLPDNPV